MVVACFLRSLRRRASLHSPRSAGARAGGQEVLHDDGAGVFLLTPGQSSVEAVRHLRRLTSQQFASHSAAGTSDEASGWVAGAGASTAAAALSGQAASAGGSRPQRWPWYPAYASLAPTDTELLHQEQSDDVVGAWLGGQVQYALQR